jgi:hypothetical protein
MVRPEYLMCLIMRTRTIVPTLINPEVQESLSTEVAGGVEFVDTPILAKQSGYRLGVQRYHCHL